MKKINRSFLKKINAIFVALLAFFGFSGCFLNEPKCMYGSPTANYVIKGSVTDKTTGNAVPRIKVEVFSSFTTVDGKKLIYVHHRDTSDVKGNFHIRSNTMIMNLNHASALFSDIDGKENGRFNDMIINLNRQDFVQTKPGDGGWHVGEFTKTLNVELTPREEYNEESN